MYIVYFGRSALRKILLFKQDTLAAWWPENTCHCKQNFELQFVTDNLCVFSEISFEMHFHHKYPTEKCNAYDKILQWHIYFHINKMSVNIIAQAIDAWRQTIRLIFAGAWRTAVNCQSCAIEISVCGGAREARKTKYHKIGLLTV